ncbi:MAG: alpha/beta hydrolase, partial [Polyangiaceae bacterium]
QGRPCETIFEAAPRIRCATLFIHGEQDALVPARSAHNIHERIQAGGGNSEFQTLPGAGHQLIYNQAAPIAERITAFLRSVRATP